MQLGLDKLIEGSKEHVLHLFPCLRLPACQKSVHVIPPTPSKACMVEIDLSTDFLKAPCKGHVLSVFGHVD